MQEKLLYRLTSNKPFETVAGNIERLAPENQFRVLAVHDVKATLAEKGFERDNLKIIEICNAGFAHKALSETPLVALFMPCRYSVYTQGDETVVDLARPSLIAEMLPDANLKELAGEIEKTLKEIMHAAV